MNVYLPKLVEGAIIFSDVVGAEVLDSFCVRHSLERLLGPLKQEGRKFAGKSKISL